MRVNDLDQTIVIYEKEVLDDFFIIGENIPTIWGGCIKN